MILLRVSDETQNPPALDETIDEEYNKKKKNISFLKKEVYSYCTCTKSCDTSPTEPVSANTNFTKFITNCLIENM